MNGYKTYTHTKRRTEISINKMLWISEVVRIRSISAMKIMAAITEDMAFELGKNT